MRVAASLLLFLFVCPVRAGMGRELGSLPAGGHDGEPLQGAQEKQTGQAQPGEKRPLTNDDVVSMVKAGLAASTIVLAIQHSSADFDTSPRALIDLQGQGVPQQVLDAMIRAGSAGHAPSAGPMARTPANGASIGKNGKWNVREEISPVDGSPTVTLRLPAEQETSAGAGQDRYPQLNIRCQSGQTDVYIQTGPLRAGADTNEEYHVRLRLDGGQPLTELWDQSRSHDSLFAPSPVELARKLAAAKKLAFEIMPSSSGAPAILFDLHGLDGELGRVANACGWSVQGVSAEELKMKNRPPSLHAIRKVLLESGWADDDNMVARKVSAIEKRTCLQVVDTSEAADAILSWTMEGFTGGILALRTKDGLVIWSKSGGFTAPLGALKQALGCPKEKHPASPHSATPSGH